MFDYIMSRALNVNQMYKINYFIITIEINKLTLEFNLSRIKVIVLIVIDSTMPSSKMRDVLQSTGKNMNLCFSQSGKNSFFFLSHSFLKLKKKKRN